MTHLAKMLQNKHGNRGESKTKISAYNRKKGCFVSVFACLTPLKVNVYQKMRIKVAWDAKHCQFKTGYTHKTKQNMSGLAHQNLSIKKTPKKGFSRAI